MYIMILQNIKGLVTNKTIRQTFHGRKRRYFEECPPQENLVKNDSHSVRKQRFPDGRYKTGRQCGKHRECSRTRSHVRSSRKKDSSKNTNKPDFHLDS